VGALIPSKPLYRDTCKYWKSIKYKSCVNLLTLKNQSQMESGCGWNVVLCEILQAAAFCRKVDDEDDAAAAAAATTLAQPFGHCFSGSSSRLADVLRLDTIRRSNTRSVDDIACVRDIIILYCRRDANVIVIIADATRSFHCTFANISGSLALGIYI